MKTKRKACVKTAGLWAFSRYGDILNKKHEPDTTRPL